jgi:cyclohexadienyl dehydratase
MRTAAIALILLTAAQDATARAEPRVLRFGMTGDYPPYAERRPDGAYIGADIVMARYVARLLGARVEWVPTDWQTLSADFAAGRFDVAIGGLTVTPERKRIGTFSVRLLDDGKRPLARCADTRRYRNIPSIDRPGVRVQINRGPAIATLAKGWFQTAQVKLNGDDADLVPALLEGRADLWVTDGVVVDHMARRYPGKLCATTRRPFTHQDKAWLIRSDPALVQQVNGALKRAIASGRWRRALLSVR